MTCTLHAQKIVEPGGFLYLAHGTLDDMGPVVDAAVARRYGPHSSTREDILLISIATGWTEANTGQPHVQQYNIDLTSEKDLKRLYSLLKKRGCLSSFRLVRRILDWSDQVFAKHEARISAPAAEQEERREKIETLLAETERLREQIKLIAHHVNHLRDCMTRQTVINDKIVDILDRRTAS